MMHWIHLALLEVKDGAARTTSAGPYRAYGARSRRGDTLSRRRARLRVPLLAGPLPGRRRLDERAPGCAPPGDGAGEPVLPVRRAGGVRGVPVHRAGSD